MDEIHCDEVKYDYRDINQEMWKNSKKLPWRLDNKYYAKREMVVLGWILRQVGGID